MPEPRKLRVFLCHASQDKPVVRELYQRLSAEGWIDPWLDEEKLLPGQDWDREIEKAVETADAVIVCLSTKSVTKEGYVQKELRKILNIALEKPEETIFIIPLRLDACELPSRLRTWHYVDYFPSKRRTQVYQRLLASLEVRAKSQSNLSTDPPKPTPSDYPLIENEPIPVAEGLYGTDIAKSTLYRTSLSIGVVYVFFVLAGLWVFNNSSLFKNYEWLPPLGVIRGGLLAYILSRMDRSSSKGALGRISALGSLISSVPLFGGTLFIILLLLIDPSSRLNTSIIFLLVLLEIILGLLSGWIIGNSLPARKK